ncbi:MAG: cytochrome c [Verrucomicrobiales bacterium]|nr:cytochrome c [Verrucomicrobiales bacterium]
MNFAASFLSVSFLAIATALVLPVEVSADDKGKAMRHGRMKKMTCAGCHGMTGNGAKRDGQLVAPAYGDSVILKTNPEMLALIILKGISSEGSNYSGAMNGLEKIYNDHDLASVMTFVRNRWGGHDDYITDEQAAAWRAKYADRTTPVTQAELEESRKSASP